MDYFVLQYTLKNRKEAWDAWRKLAEEAIAAGYTGMVENYQPHKRAGHRQIGKSIALLGEAFERAKKQPPKLVAICPECGSNNIEEYMMMYGPMWCLECGFRVEDKSASPNPFIQIAAK